MIRVQPEPCNFQGDLDGVQAWSNQSVMHGDCTGLVELTHDSEDYGLDWSVGTTNASGSLDGTSVQFKENVSEEEGETKREVAVDMKDALDYPDPSLVFREDDEEWSVPECILKGEC